MVKKILKYSIAVIGILIFIIAGILLITKNTSSNKAFVLTKELSKSSQVSTAEEDGLATQGQGSTSEEHSESTEGQISTSEDDGSLTYRTDGDDAANYIDGDKTQKKSKWDKNGDTWTYTFYVDDPNAQWYIWEDSDSLMKDYTGDYTEYNTGTLFTEETLDSFTPPANVEGKENSNGNLVYTWQDTENSYKVIDNGDGTYKKITTKLSFTITNYNIDKDDPVYYGNLTINKVVNDSNGNVVTENDDNTNFIFTVKLTASDANKAFIQGIKSFGDVVFKDGIGTVSLKAGGSITISDIPAGISYSVTEKSDDRYETSYDSNSGTITKNSNNSVTFTNIKKPEPEPGEETEKYTNITIKKVVTGNSEVEDSYNLEIAFSELKANKEYTLSNGESFTSDEGGLASVSVILKNNETVTVQNIPVGSKYKVYEKAGNYISSYVITDSNNKGLINNSANSNTKENTALSTATETADAGEDVTITFTNKKAVTQNLKIAKVVTDEEDKNSYIFNIEFGNMEENSSFNSSVGKVTAEPNGKAEITIYLAGEEEAEFYSVPVGTTYRVTELASGSIASYAIKDANGINNFAKESDANTKAKKALSTEIETVNEGEEANVTFTNDTENQEQDTVSTSIGVEKEVLKIDGTNFEDCEEEFTFELKADNNDNPMPEKSTVTIKGNGNASFGTITFDETGTYSYTITEKKGTLGYYDYDETVYSVVYEVTNPEGLLEITKSVKKNGFVGDVIAFTNKVSKTYVKVSKIDEDGNSLNGATLQILDLNKNVVDKWITDGQAHIKELEPGEYLLHEAKAPHGYYKVEDIRFTVAEDGKILVNSKEVEEKEAEEISEEVKEIIVTDNLVKGKITLTKTGEVLDKVTLQGKALGYGIYEIAYVTKTLKNATFELYAREDIVTASGKLIYKANEKIAEQTTGKDGIAIFEDLYLGKYYIVETNAPEGFEPIKKEIDLILAYENDEAKVVFIEREVNNDRIKLDLSVTKNEKGNVDKKVKDAIYGVYNVDTIGIIEKDTLLAVAKTDENGYAKFDIDLPRGKYYVKEIESPEGYLVSTEVKEVDFQETKEVNLVFEDDYIKVQIKKVDLTTGKDVIGAKLQVLDKDGNVVEAYNGEGTTKTKLEWTTEQAVDKDGKLVVDEDGEPVAKVVTFTKLPVGKYTLREVQAPDAYIKAENIEFEIVETNEIQLVQMKDDYTKVKFEKVDENGNFVEGAKLRVKDLNGNEVASWVTNKEPYELIKKLVPGRKYILEEVEAPSDYEKAENIEFTVSEDGREDIIRMVGKKIVNMPKTGQLFIIYYVLIALIGISGFLILLAKRRKKEEDEEVKENK